VREIDPRTSNFFSENNSRKYFIKSTYQPQVTPKRSGCTASIREDPTVSSVINDIVSRPDQGEMGE
jgi:hypothetical protein